MLLGSNPYDKNHAPLGSCQVGETMQSVSLDILGTLALTKKENKYILVMVDCFSNWTEAVALPDQEASTVAKAFVDTIICHFEPLCKFIQTRVEISNQICSKKFVIFFQIDKTEPLATIRIPMEMLKGSTEL